MRYEFVTLPVLDSVTLVEIGVIIPDIDVELTGESQEWTVLGVRLLNTFRRL
ncbi:MAG: hypothetical protein J07HX64_00335 [halophilic archaeon J07HX64]|nr:MAG: hypothetical protein J07HX64_00335 [halophilic archaeon J07HX64]